MSEIKGKIKFVGQTQTFGNNGFTKRELVVTTEEQYPQHIMIEFHKDKCDLLNNIQVGQEVTVSINLRGREWINPQGEAKYFNSLQGWKLEAVPLSQAPKQQAPPPQNPGGQLNTEEENDDLPF